MSAVLQVSNISKRFGGITAVNGVSFDVQEGEILGLIGPNGCGKSTLFNCILGQLTPSDGEVKLDGRTVTGSHCVLALGSIPNTVGLGLEEVRDAFS